ncbi:MAG TPA: hypothetical protein VG650_14745 [Mycobacteriales bacterium]|nr:hypothetical protein [Mycobacteriales bacterium]
MSGDGPQRPEGQRYAFGLLILGVVVALVAVFLVTTHNENEAPFTATQAHPKLAGFQVLTPTNALGTNITAALRRLGGSRDDDIYVPNNHRDWQYVVGRIDVGAQPVDSDAEYEVIVIDNRLHRVVPQTYSFPEPHQSSGTGQGWDGAAESLHERFDWQQRPDVDQDAFFTPGRTTSFPFYARLDASTLPVTDLHKDLSVVLALTHGSDSVYWAERLN